MEVYENILETVGNTPLIRLRSYEERGIKIFAKLETFNPGNSSKDRIALPIILRAEAEGLLKPGGTIIEATSGNTGLALAFVGITRGYNVILVMPDKMSPTKINLVKAVGCEVIVAPTEVEPDDPRSYYSIAKKLSETVPNSFYTQQYWNLENQEAHYKSTGPEIWRQTGGTITHYFAGVGTGGTISGTSRYLKEVNPKIRTIGVDPEGSILAYYHEHKNTDIEAKTYKIEGVGEDIIPSNVLFEFIDEFVKVNDVEAFEETRTLAKKFGIIVGSSGGMAVRGVLKHLKTIPDDSVIVVVLPDTGERYLDKAFSLKWLRDNQLIKPAETIKEIIEAKSPTLRGIKSLQNEDYSIEQLVFLFRKFPQIQLVLIGAIDYGFRYITKTEVRKVVLSKSNIKIPSINDLPTAKIYDDTHSLDYYKARLVEESVILIQTKDNLEVLTLSDFGFDDS